WALFFTQFEFKVTYRPGSKNIKADALSHQFESSQTSYSGEQIIPSTLILGPVQWDIMTEITEYQNTDPPPPECPPDRTYVPQALRNRVMQLVHNSPSTGHPGITATAHLISNRFWWPTLQRDTIEFVHNCSTCNITKSSHQRPAGLLLPLPIPQRPWSHIAIDFVTDLPSSRNFTNIFTACRLIPLTKLPTAFETAEILMEQYRIGGHNSHHVSGLLSANISVSISVSPQATTQNPTARSNTSTMNSLASSYCHANQSDWSRYILWAEYAQNSLSKPATGLTPFQCVLGFQPPLFPWTGEPSQLPAVNDWLQRSEETWNAAHVHLQQAVRRVRDQANRLRRPSPTYTPGQWVWLSSRDLRLRLPCRKLSPRYVGPFKILRQIPPVSYSLALPANYLISPTFHVSLLKPAGVPRGVEDQDEAEDVSTPPVIVDGEEAYQ
ncbi:hypothetical protein M9458_025842, partial [Cirrhinus mrigala]